MSPRSDFRKDESAVMVRTLRKEDEAAWLRMREQMWPGSEVDAARWLAREDAVTLVAELEPETLIGFAEAGERAYADGCDSSPVAFLEGWYVQPEYQHQGLGGHLLRAVLAWAKSRQLKELASDSLLDDHAAVSAHLANGFEEVERSVKFRMNIQGLE